MLDVIRLLIMAAAGWFALKRGLTDRFSIFGLLALFLLLFVLPYALSGNDQVAAITAASSKTPAPQNCPPAPGDRNDASIRSAATTVNDGRFDASIELWEHEATVRHWLGWAGIGKVDDGHVLPSLYEQKGQYKESFDLYNKYAEEGDKDGEFHVGRFYLDGKAPNPTPESAFLYFERSAAQDYAPAQFGLGALYADGVGVKCDISQAIALWFKAGRQAYEPAIVALGLRDLGHAKPMLDREPIEIDFTDPRVVVQNEQKLMTFATGFDAKKTLPEERRKAVIEDVGKACSGGIELIEKAAATGNYSQYLGLKSWSECYDKAENSLF